MFIIGDKEIEKSEPDKPIITVRRREGNDLGQQNLYDFMQVLKEQIEKRV